MEENYKRTAEGNLITCAVIVQDPTGAILAVHPTGQKFDQNWSLPKGLATEGETEQVAALRELFEETGLVGQFTLSDLGTHPYRPGKDIHLFRLFTGLNFTEEFLLNRFCTSLFMSPKSEEQIAVLEIDAYRIIKLDQWNKFNRSMREVLTKVLKANS